jgi:hypothetical protein
MKHRYTRRKHAVHKRRRGGFAEEQHDGVPFLVVGEGENITQRQSLERCIEALEEMFIVRDVTADGNCFFHSVRQFGRITGVPRLNHHTTWLRRQVARYVNRHWNERYSFSFEAPKATVLADIRRTCSWDCEAGDAIPVIAPDALRINLTIYDAVFVPVQDVGKRYPKGHHVVNRIRYVDPEYDVHVQVLRVGGGHFMLILPLDGGYVVPNDLKKAEPKEVDPEPGLDYIDGQWVEVPVDPSELVAPSCSKMKGKPSSLHLSSNSNSSNNETAATAAVSSNQIELQISQLLSNTNLSNAARNAQLAELFAQLDLSSEPSPKKTAKKTVKKVASSKKAAATKKKTATKKKASKSALTNNERAAIINQIMSNNTLTNEERQQRINELYANE